jgi:MinD-like ATPase involved in chromosome partitioning or flagellar assembly
MAHPLQVAIACPEREGELWAMVEDPAFMVNGRPCAFAGPCASVAELREALSRQTADVVLVSASLNAIPFETLRELVSRRRAVVLATDPLAERWREFPARVLSVDPGADELAQAIQEALLGNGTGSPRTSGAGRRSSSRRGVASVTEPVGQHLPTEPTSTVIAVSKPYRGEGVTLVTTNLAFATGVREKRTILLDANTRVGSVEFHLGANPARNVAQLIRRVEETGGEDAAWNALLPSELQPMGAPSDGQVLCGITKPSQRTQLADNSFKQLIATMREHYRYIFLPTSGSGWTLDDPQVDQLALHLADRILLVVRPDVEGITMAQRVLQDWPERDKVHLVLNQVGLPDQLSRGDAERKLRAPVVAVLPFDPWKVAEARARNRPVVCQRGCRLSGPLIDLAERITSGHIELAPDEEPRPSPWWHRWPVALAGAMR